MNTEIKKKCNMCGELLTLDNFHCNPTTKYKKSNRCKKCTLYYSKERYWKEPDKFRLRGKIKSRKRLDDGLCIVCGVELKDLEKRMCSSCRNKHNIQRKNRRDKYKNLVFSYYGDVCVCCGEKEKRFLTIDHINNDGALHRKELKRKGSGVGEGFYKWLVINNFPEGFQILCWNCNLGKYFNNGICPHKEGV